MERKLAMVWTWMEDNNDQEICLENTCMSFTKMLVVKVGVKGEG